MAITTTLAPQFEDTLKASLKARPALADVHIESTPVGREAGDWIMLGAGESSAVSANEAWDVMGNVRRREDVTLDCMIEVTRSGAGETTVLACRDRAHELFAEVATELREAAFPVNNHPLMQVFAGRAHRFEVSAWSERRGVGDGQRWTQILFSITYRGDLPSS